MSELELILSLLTYGRGELLELLGAEFSSLSGALNLETSTAADDPLWTDEAGADLELVFTNSKLGVRLARLPEVRLRPSEDTPETLDEARQRLKILSSALRKRSAALTAMGRYLASKHASEMTNSAMPLPRILSEAVSRHASVEDRLIVRVTRNARCKAPRGDFDLRALFES
jgi:hypothetical protein